VPPPGGAQRGGSAAAPIRRRPLNIHEFNVPPGPPLPCRLSPPNSPPLNVGIASLGWPPPRAAFFYFSGPPPHPVDRPTGFQSCQRPQKRNKRPESAAPRASDFSPRPVNPRWPLAHYPPGRQKPRQTATEVGPKAFAGLSPFFPGRTTKLGPPPAGGGTNAHCPKSPRWCPFWPPTCLFFCPRISSSGPKVTETRTGIPFPRPLTVAPNLSGIFWPKLQAPAPSCVGFRGKRKPQRRPLCPAVCSGPRAQDGPRFGQKIPGTPKQRPRSTCQTNQTFESTLAFPTFSSAPPTLPFGLKTVPPSPMHYKGRPPH